VLVEFTWSIVILTVGSVMDWSRVGSSERRYRVCASRHMLELMLTFLNSSIAPVFRDLHNFSTNAIGLAFLSLTVGAWLGFATSFYQERLYRQGHAKRGPEARLYLVCVAAITFPIGMFIYAWCAFPSVPWIGLCIGIVVSILSLCILEIS
jgi:hypothetical protein